MRKYDYICNAKQQHDVLGIHTNTAYCVSSCVTSAPSSRGCLATISRRVRSLFVHTKRKTCYTMPNNNKQAMTAKHSNRSAIDIVIVISTIVISILLLIFAPSVLMAIAKFIGCLALVAMAVVPMMHSLNIFYNER